MMDEMLYCKTFTVETISQYTQGKLTTCKKRLLNYGDVKSHAA